MTTFYLGDCLEVMKDLSDGSIDCFICDLPYGCLTGGAGKEKTKRKDKGSTDSIAGCQWDIKIDLVKFWEQVKRLAKNEHTPVLMFCNTRFGIDLINSNPSWFRYDIVWEKTLAVGFLRANKMPMSSHEMIYVFSKAGAFYKRIDIEGDFQGQKHSGLRSGHTPFGGGIERGDILPGRRCVKSVVCISNPKIKASHPTQKPEELYEWLLKRYVPDGGTILDPTAGSFNSCFVADRLGLTAIGIEKDEEFFKKAVKRLNG
jgi:site-specific DNA-methyltransferase (adenine-specific)